MSERTLEHDNSWADMGSCTSADPDLFFPPSGVDTAYARSICRSCPVRRECLDFALASGQKHGIWGGMTESQRRRLRRRTHPSNPIERNPVARHTVEHHAVEHQMVEHQLVEHQVVDESVVVAVRHLRLVPSGNR